MFYRRYVTIKRLKIVATIWGSALTLAGYIEIAVIARKLVVTPYLPNLLVSATPAKGTHNRRWLPLDTWRARYVATEKSAAMVVGRRVRNVYNLERIVYTFRQPDYQKLT